MIASWAITLKRWQVETSQVGRRESFLFLQASSCGAAADCKSAAIPSNNAHKVEAASGGASITTFPSPCAADLELREELADVGRRRQSALGSPGRGRA